MMEQNPASVATAYFDAVSRGDIPTVMAALAPDVIWHQSGANRFSGTHRGHDEIGALLGGMMTVSEGTFALSVTGAVMVNGELVAVPVRFRGTREGASMDMTGVDLLTVRGGSIVEMRLFSEDATAEDAFWGAA